MEWKEVRELDDIKLNIGGRRDHCPKRHYEGWVAVDRRSNGAGYSVRHNFPNKMGVEDASTDAILSEHFLEHVTLGNAHLIFCECLRALKQGGKLRVAVPDINHPRNEADRKKGRDSSPYHKSIYSLDSLTGMLAVAGFRIIEPMSFWLYKPEYKHTHRRIDWNDGWVRRTVGHDRRNRQRRPFGKLWATRLIVDAIK